MKNEFLPNNTHLVSGGDFSQSDFHLRLMGQQKYIFHSPVIDQFPIDIPGIYNLGGGRQVGKTTLLKQWMLHLLQNGIDPRAIAFFSCELIVDEQSLYRIIMDQLNEMPKKGMLYLILDEITYVLNWDKAIKYLADTGVFERVVVVISGSDLVMMQEARKRFPGRRGKAKKVDFHYYPLSFRQVVQLKNKLPSDFDYRSEPTSGMMKILFNEFKKYLIHGGFLTAINEYEMTKTISNATLATYADWIRGDIIKHNKKEHYLRELLQTIIKHYSSQISWRNLVKGLSVDHVQTAIDYVTLLESMDAVFIQAALIEDKLVGAPKKQRKFMFCDPFIFHSVNSWLKETEDPFHDQILAGVENSRLSSLLVESVVATHFRRCCPTYYIKAENEVDVAYVKNDAFWPIEVKWTNQIRTADTKQIFKYKNGQIWAKVYKESKIDHTPILPLPWALFNVED